jgi:hypothetical protein
MVSIGAANTAENRMRALTILLLQEILDEVKKPPATFEELSKRYKELGEKIKTIKPVKKSPLNN